MPGPHPKASSFEPHIKDLKHAAGYFPLQSILAHPHVIPPMSPSCLQASLPHQGGRRHPAHTNTAAVPGQQGCGGRQCAVPCCTLRQLTAVRRAVRLQPVSVCTCLLRAAAGAMRSFGSRSCQVRDCDVTEGIRSPTSGVHTAGLHDVRRMKAINARIRTCIAGRHQTGQGFPVGPLTAAWGETRAGPSPAWFV